MTAVKAGDVPLGVGKVVISNVQQDLCKLKDDDKIRLSSKLVLLLVTAFVVFSCPRPPHITRYLLLGRRLHVDHRSIAIFAFATCGLCPV